VAGVSVALVFDSTTTQSLTVALDNANADVSRAQRQMLRLIADADNKEIWRDSGARDTAHWLTIRYGISEWKSRRWVGAAHALENLPSIAEALERGRLGIDKVVELTRFAAPETEARLIRWATTVSVGAIRHRGDLEARASITDVRETERNREVSWWYFDEGRRFGLEADLPASSGPVIVNALEREAERIAALPGEEKTRCTRRLAGPMPWWRCARLGSLPIQSPTGPRSWSTRAWTACGRTRVGARSRAVR
jgi:hypothetical protein